LFANKEISIYIVKLYLPLILVHTPRKLTVKFQLEHLIMPNSFPYLRERSLFVAAGGTEEKRDG
jgi:hypothetical protein